MVLHECKRWRAPLQSGDCKPVTYILANRLRAPLQTGDVHPCKAATCTLAKRRRALLQSGDVHGCPSIHMIMMTSPSIGRRALASPSMGRRALASHYRYTPLSFDFLQLCCSCRVQVLIFIGIELTWLLYSILFQKHFMNLVFGTFFHMYNIFKYRSYIIRRESSYGEFRIAVSFKFSLSTTGYNAYVSQLNTCCM